ncbi:DUF5372 family protein [Kibdelosporangium banguiense]|uniref:DUF5372 family protein n=1 Tax=Kibdelosporangium banguiense TaxID=1365924 RepID=UPI0035592933
MRVTHRFHPLSGREFEFVVHRQNWGEDRVLYRSKTHRCSSGSLAVLVDEATE